MARGFGVFDDRKNSFTKGTKTTHGVCGLSRFFDAAAVGHDDENDRGLCRAAAGSHLHNAIGLLVVKCPAGLTATTTDHRLGSGFHVLFLTDRVGMGQ